MSKARYAYTTGEVGEPIETVPYVYGDTNWKDKLTGYDGQSITYDEIGNPLNDGIWTYTWGAGRQLRQMSKPGTTVEFSYDHNGLRTQKTVTENGVTTTTSYTLHGKLVTHLTCGSDSLHFFYDAQSRPAKVSFNGVMYTYLHNLQGDIVGIVDNAGALVVEYRYDAWGRKLSVTGSLAGTLGRRNPFRYRGYVWDEETGLYYLNSRYYNETVLRFINSDEYINDHYSAWTYCNNQPITKEDSNGDASNGINPWWMIKPDFGKIHREVQNDICELYGYSEEFTVHFSDGTIGRIDLIKSLKNILEVKPNSVTSIEKGRKQIERYMHSNESRSVGGFIKNIEPVVGDFISTDGEFHIWYSLVEEGLIGYYFEAVSEYVFDSLLCNLYGFGICLTMQRLLMTSETEEQFTSGFGGGHGGGGSSRGGGAGRGR